VGIAIGSIAPTPGGICIAGIAGIADWAAADGFEREDDFDFEEEEGAEDERAEDERADEEGAEDDGADADGAEDDAAEADGFDAAEADGFDDEREAEDGAEVGGCTAAIDVARAAAYWVGSGANGALGVCTGCGAEPRALPV
jgi:hypothetical protein